jgi:hypothetical protein
VKNNRLRAFNTLATIRLRRHEALERQRVQEQAALASLTAAAEEKAGATAQAQSNVAQQVDKIAQLLVAGNRFQVADYIGQQDYQAWLEAKLAAARAEQTQAEAAVTRQQDVLQQARLAVARNLAQQKRLEERIRQIRIDIDVAQMDAEDEDAEETTVSRRKLQAAKAVLDASASGQAGPGRGEGEQPGLTDGGEVEQETAFDTAYEIGHGSSREGVRQSGARTMATDRA